MAREVGSIYFARISRLVRQRAERLTSWLTRALTSVEMVLPAIDINSNDSGARRCSGATRSRTVIYGFMEEGKRQTKTGRRRGRVGQVKWKVEMAADSFRPTGHCGKGSECGSFLPLLALALLRHAYFPLETGFTRV